MTIYVKNGIFFVSFTALQALAEITCRPWRNYRYALSDCCVQLGGITLQALAEFCCRG